MNLRLGLVVVVAVATGCKTQHEDFDRLPGGGGGGGFGGGGGGGGGGTDAGIDGNGFVGNVCVMADLRDFTSCATTGAGDLTVKLGNKTAITADDGSFVIEPSVGGVLWHVSGDTVVTTASPFANTFTLYTIATADYEALLANNLTQVVAGQGSIVVRAIDNDIPVAGAAATVVPTATSTIFYDGDDPDFWEVVSTGVRGVVWIPEIRTGAATVTVSLPGNGSVDAPLVVEDQSITFLTVGP